MWVERREGPTMPRGVQEAAGDQSLNECVDPASLPQCLETTVAPAGPRVCFRSSSDVHGTRPRCETTVEELYHFFVSDSKVDFLSMILRLSPGSNSYASEPRASRSLCRGRDAVSCRVVSSLFGRFPEASAALKMYAWLTSHIA